MMRELELERQLWKRKVGELQAELEEEKQKVKREVENVAPSVAQVVIQPPPPPKEGQSYVEVLRVGKGDRRGVAGRTKKRKRRSRRNEGKE